MMEQEINKKNGGRETRRASRLWALLWLAGAAAFAVAAWNPYIQYDESYTLALIRHPAAQLIRITGKDVHPPLYYLLVRAFSAPFGNALWAVRVFNLLPLAGMCVLGRTVVRRLWGNRAGLWFTFLAFALPANLSYLLPEMRMYALASLLETAAFLAGYCIQCGRFDALREKRAWLLLASAGILAAYTQYYALIGIALLYVWLVLTQLVRLRREKREGKGGRAAGNLRRLAACIGGSVLLYLPWLAVLLRQFGKVRRDYWIAPISLRDCAAYLLFPFYSSLPAAAGALLLLAAGAVVLAGLLRRRKDGGQTGADWRLLGGGCFVYGGVIAAGIAVSLAVRPVFSVRYVKCGLGIFTLCLAVLASGCFRKGRRLLAALFGLFAALDLVVTAGKNRQNFLAYEEMRAYAAGHLTDGSALAYLADSHYMGIFTVYFPELPGILPDAYWKEEYEAFAPALMTRSDYEARFGSLRERDFWAVDIGNAWLYAQWDGETWNAVEHCEPFVFYDQTDRLTCMFSHLAGQEAETGAPQEE